VHQYIEQNLHTVRNQFHVTDKLTAAHHGHLIHEPKGQGENTGAALELDHWHFHPRQQPFSFLIILLIVQAQKTQELETAFSTHMIAKFAALRMDKNLQADFFIFSSPSTFVAYERAYNHKRREWKQKPCTLCEHSSQVNNATAHPDSKEAVGNPTVRLCIGHGLGFHVVVEGRIA
jgi:hypothetical protein